MTSKAFSLGPIIGLGVKSELFIESILSQDTFIVILQTVPTVYLGCLL